MVDAPGYVTDGIAVLAAFVGEAAGAVPVGLNSNERWECGPFTLRDFCWCDGETHRGGECPPNFEYRDGRGLEVTWYKHLGRSTRMSRVVSAREWAQILMACLQAVSHDTPVEVA